MNGLTRLPGNDDVARIMNDNINRLEDGITTNAATLEGYGLTAILQAVYPVGSTFISNSDTMPELIANIGTWVRLKGYVIVGLDEAQTEFDTIGETGGAKTHTLTTAQMPTHSHLPPSLTGFQLWGNGAGRNQVGSGGTLRAISSTNIDHLGFGTATGDTGQGGSHNNLQPYKVKYMWERTA